MRRGGGGRAGGHAPILLALIVIGALVYGRTFDDEWHLDDRVELEWPGVRAGSPEVSAGHYRGVVTLWLWALNHRVSGESPWSYHLLNLLVHLFNAALVYALAWRWSPAERTTRRLFAATAAVVFVSHPLATQSVSYVTQRSTSVATACLLASLVGWLALRDGSGRGRLAAAGATLAAFALGLHTKPVVMAWPVLVLAAERWRGPPRRLDRLAAFVLLAAASLAVVRATDLAPRVVRWMSPLPPGEAVVAPDREPRLSPADYARTQPRVIAAYLKLMVWPRGQSLEHEVAVVRSVRDVRFVAPAALLVALALTAVVARRRRPVVAFGILLLFATLAPTSSVVPSRDLLFEHRAYAPLAGFALVAADAVARAGGRRRRTARLAPAVLALVLGGVAWSRNAVWDTELSLWTDAAAKAPGRARAHVNLGLALQSAGRLDEAAAAYRRALALRPDHPFARNNLGNVRRAQGDAAGAADLFRAAIAADSAYAEPWINLGNLAVDRGDPAAAEPLYRRALAIDPRSVVARYDLAKSLELQGRHAESVREYERVAAARPRDALFANDLGCARLAAGDAAGAERELRRAIGLDDRSPAAWYNLGLALAARGARSEAASAFEAALDRDPHLLPARTQLRALEGNR